MALTVTIGGADSDSYVTVAEYIAYQSNVHNRDFSSTDNAILESNLRQATQFLDAAWDWKGIPAANDQALAFPRIINQTILGYSVQSDEIPTRIKKAIYEIAHALGEGLNISPNVEGGSVKSSAVAAGSARVSTTYEEIFLLPKMTAVEMLVSPYHNGQVIGTGNVKLVRG